MNTAAVSIGCEVCPSNLEVAMKFSEARTLVESVGQGKQCPKCKTQWNLAKVELYGVIMPPEKGKSEEANILATPTYVPADLSKTKALKFMDMITEQTEEEPKSPDLSASFPQ